MAFAYAVVAGSLFCACLQDPPAPTQCPPGGAAPANSCSVVQANAVDSCGVLRDDVRRCLNLLSCKAKCDDAAGECPSDPNACYPPGDCPGAVTAVAPASTCYRMPASAFKENSSGCSCGCFACLATCDGKGPVLYRNGPSGDAGAGAPLATIDLEGLLPAKGSLSVYALMRGTGTVEIEASGSSAGATGLGEFRRKSASSWEDVVTLKSSVDGRRYSWGQEPNSGPPKTLSLYAGEGVLALEIDCIIPFVEEAK